MGLTLQFFLRNFNTVKIIIFIFSVGKIFEYKMLKIVKIYTVFNY